MTKAKTKIKKHVHKVVYEVEGVLFDDLKEAEMYAKDMDEDSNCDTCGIDLPAEQLEDGECWQCTCDHEASEYHPEDQKNNIPETHYCSECGSDLLHA